MLFIQPAVASKEGVLSFSEFVIKSDGLKGSGEITVTGNKTKDGKYEKISVFAFGKILLVPKEILDQIPSRYQNGIQLSYERGYLKTGGRTVYIVFHKGFTSGIGDRFIIAVKENGSSGIIQNNS